MKSGWAAILLAGLLVCSVAARAEDVTVLPVAAGFAFGRLVLKMSPVILLGALAGSITSTPALVIINKGAKSSLPSLGYAGAYAFANILLTMIGQLVMQF